MVATGPAVGQWEAVITAGGLLQRVNSVWLCSLEVRWDLILVLYGRCFFSLWGSSPAHLWRLAFGALSDFIRVLNVHAFWISSLVIWVRHAEAVNCWFLSWRAGGCIGFSHGGWAHLVDLEVVNKVSLTVFEVTLLHSAHHALLALTKVALVVGHRPWVTGPTYVVDSGFLDLIWVNLLN